MMSKNPLEILKGNKLSAIVFILDYLQIQFDTAVVTFLTYPKVELEGKNYSFGESEYRNTICAFIGKAVASVIYRENELFSLNFDQGRLYCSIAPEDYVLSEMVIVDTDSGEKIVF